MAQTRRQERLRERVRPHMATVTWCTVPSSPTDRNCSPPPATPPATPPAPGGAGRIFSRNTREPVGYLDIHIQTAVGVRQETLASHNNDIWFVSARACHGIYWPRARRRETRQRRPSDWIISFTPASAVSSVSLDTFPAPARAASFVRVSRDSVSLSPRLVMVSLFQIHHENVRTSASKRSIRRFVITEKAPTRAFSWLKAATTAFTFKTLC